MYFTHTHTHTLTVVSMETSSEQHGGGANGVEEYHGEPWSLWHKAEGDGNACQDWVDQEGDVHTPLDDTLVV